MTHCIFFHTYLSPRYAAALLQVAFFWAGFIICSYYAITYKCKMHFGARLAAKASEEKAGWIVGAEGETGALCTK